VDLIIDGCPAWAAAAGTGGDVSPPPASAAQYAAFAARVAGRYAPEGVRMFEIWNEPNNAEFWSPRADPAAYTADLKAAYASIKAVDPSAWVISGGLAPELNDRTNIAAVTFLQAMYADGAKGSFDAVGDHPYSYPALPDTYEPWSGWSQMAQTSPSLRSVMTSYGDAAKQIWITEVGAPAGGPGGVSEAAQATALTQAIKDARTTSWIGGIYLYTWQDGGTDPDSYKDWFGLLTVGGTPKPAYAAVGAAMGRCRRSHRCPLPGT
jgi:polysaccharide biosynthesis protein PslG